MNKFKNIAIKAFGSLTFILGGFMIYGFSYNYNTAKSHAILINSDKIKKKRKATKQEKLEQKLLKIKGDK